MSPRDERLDPDQARALGCVLDLLVPPSTDGRLPGAGELGLAGFLESRMEASPDLRSPVVAGLAALERAAQARGAAGFAALPPEARREALLEVGASEPAFLPGLLFHTYVGYYQEPRVLAGLGLPPRPPFPEGYAMEPADLSLLEPVRRRAPFYR